MHQVKKLWYIQVSSEKNICINCIICLNRGNGGRMLTWGECSPNFMLMGEISKRRDSGEGNSLSQIPSQKMSEPPKKPFQ